MKIPQIFLSKNKSLERKTEDLLKGYKKEADDSFRLESLKEGKTREEQKEFLEILVKHIPELIERTREEMGLTGINEIYLDKPCQGYRTRLTVNIDGHFEFHRAIGQDLMYKADLDDKELYSYDGLAPIYDYLNTYPDREPSYSTPYGDHLKNSFKNGVEMYECIKSFLEG